MNIIQKLTAGSILALSSAAPAFAAQCTLNGQPIPCDQMPAWLWLIPLVMFGVGIFCFVFWLVMLLDAIRNQKENQIAWVLVILFTNILGALIYYFVEKRKRKA